MKLIDNGLYKDYYIKPKQMAENKRPGMKLVKCMNHDPETSKWGQYAPEGGCDETMHIDEKSDRGLCFRCTSRSVTNLSNFGSHDGPE